jgi:hypothetical protein
MNQLLGETKSPVAESGQVVPVRTEDECHPAEPSKRKKGTLTRNPEKHKKIMQGPVRDLALVEASRSGQDPVDKSAVRRESPWENYMKVYECELAGRFDVAIPRVRPQRLVAIRTIRGKGVEQTLRLFKRIQHPNILSSQDLYLHEGSLFILHDDIPVSLDHIVACEAYPDEVELAAILSQVSSLYRSTAYSMLITINRYSTAFYFSRTSGLNIRI